MTAYSIPAMRAQFLPPTVAGHGHKQALNLQRVAFHFSTRQRNDATTICRLRRRRDFLRRSRLITQLGSHGGGHPPGIRCVVASLR
jgi:hypothetical protein